MAEKVYVTRAQRRAAEMIVERSALSGKAVRPGVSKIAHSRSASTGRYVAQATTSKHSRTASGEAK